MNASSEAYRDNGYSVFEAKDSRIAWKYFKSPGLELDGCLYARRILQGTDDQIKLIPLNAVQFAALQDDNAVEAFIVQELVK